MPLYQYKCGCGSRREAFNRVAERQTNAPECHGPMAIELCANLGYVQRECHYVCPVTGKNVTSNRQRTNIMAEHGLVDANDLNPAKGIAKAKEQKRRDEREGAKLAQPYRAK